MPRTRNLFDPKSKEPYKLSRSRLDRFLKCPCCPMNAPDLLIITAYIMNIAVERQHSINKVKNKAILNFEEHFQSVSYDHSKNEGTLSV